MVCACVRSALEAVLDAVTIVVPLWRGFFPTLEQGSPPAQQVTATRMPTTIWQFQQSPPAQQDTGASAQSSRMCLGRCALDQRAEYGTTLIGVPILSSCDTTTSSFQHEGIIIP